MTFVVEVGLSAGAGVDPTYLRLDDPVAGLLDSGQVLAPGGVMTDLSFDSLGHSRVMAFSIDRGSTQGAGALVEYAAGTLSLTLRDDGGDLDPTSIPEAIPGARIRLSKIWAGQSYPLFTGTIDSWLPEHRWPSQAVVHVTASDMLASVGGYTRNEVAAVGAGENSGARVNRVLDSISWPAGQRDVDTGASVLTATTLAGNALDELRQTARAEVGEVWADTAGVIRYRNRHALYLEDRSITVQATFGSGGAGTVTAPVGTPKTSTLTDDFRAIDPVKFPTRSYASAAGWRGRLTLPAPGGNAVVSTNPNRYDLTGSTLRIQAARLPSLATASCYLMARVSYTPDSQVFIGMESGNLLMREVVAGVVSDTTLTFDRWAFRWWGLRWDSGTLYWETSTSGLTNSYTVRRSKATTLDLSSVIVSIEGVFLVSAGAANWFEFSHLNLQAVTPL